MDSLATDLEVAGTNPLTKWSAEPTVKDLKKDLEEAKPIHDNQVSKVQNWLDNLHVRGAAKVKSGKGRSSHVPRLIRKQAEWRYASLSEPFLSSPDLFDATPVSWEDRKSAEQNALILNNQFNTKLNRVKLIDDYVRTAVDEGTVIVRVGWDYREELVTEIAPVYEFIPNPEYGQVMMELTQLSETNPTAYTAETPEELLEAHQLFLQDGIPYEPIITGQEEVETVKVIANQPTVDVCDYRNVIPDPSCNGDLKKANFVIHSFESSTSELEKTGLYKNLDKINKENNSILGEPDHATNTPNNFNFSDEARKKFVVYEYWGYWDINGTGNPRPIVAAWVGNVMIRMEENPYPDQEIPFVAVPYLPVRNEVYGEPDGELLEENQKIIGAVTRGMLDILGRSANAQTGIRKDMLDGINRRRYEKGMDYEFNQNVDPRQGVHMHVFPEIPQSAPLMLQAQNQDAESLTGVKAFTSGITGQALGETATGVRGALDAASKRELGILRRLADGMVQIGRKIIAMNAVFLEEEEVVRLTNEEFVKIRRDDLAGELDLRLTVSTAEEDNQKVQTLAFLLQTTAQSLDFEMNKIMLSELVKLHKMPDLAKKIEDFQPQPDPLEQELKMLEIEEKKAEINERNARAMERQAQAQLDLAKARQVSSDADLKDLDFIEQESGVKQERELQKHGEQARANMQLEALKARLNTKNKADK